MIDGKAKCSWGHTAMQFRLYMNLLDLGTVLHESAGVNTSAKYVRNTPNIYILDSGIPASYIAHQEVVFKYRWLTRANAEKFRDIGQFSLNSHVRPVSVLRRDALTSQLFRRLEFDQSSAVLLTK